VEKSYKSKEKWIAKLDEEIERNAGKC